jgi:hypothetical protein
MDRAECRTQDAEISGPQLLGAGVLVTTVAVVVERGNNYGLYVNTSGIGL